MKKMKLLKKGLMLVAVVFGLIGMGNLTTEVHAASTDLIIPEGTTEIGDNEFYGMTFTGSLVIPDSVTRIGDKAFYNCGFSGELIIPDSVEYIGEYAFYDCDFSGNLLIPESVETIGARAFYYGNGLEDTLTILGDSLSIGENAFYGCNFTDIYIASLDVSFPYDTFGYPECVFSYTSNSESQAVHAPYNSTVRAYIADWNQSSSIKLGYTQWEGRYDVEEMELSADILPLGLGKSQTLTLSVVPAVAAEQTFYWESSDETVATVENGVVTAVGYGVATIEAYTSMGDSVTCQATVLPFTDVNANSWEYTGIAYVYGYGMMSGTTNTTFKPGGKLTRAEFVTALHSYNGKPNVAYSERFTDVPNGKWYTVPVLWAAENNVTAGYGDRFGVADNITRAQFVTMLYAYGKQTGAVTESVSGNLNDFADCDDVESWAKEGMIWATQNGLVGGKVKNGKTYLDPQGTATRAECATIMMQYDRNYGNR